MHVPRFEGSCYNCQIYGHRAFECRSKSMWSSNKLAKVRSHENFYNWDYNTRKSCHYFQDYGNVAENCIRTHFRIDYKRWFSQTTWFRYLKTSHISKHCPTRSKAPNFEFDKGKGKTNVEHIRGEMNKTWKNRWIQHIQWTDHFT